MKLGKICITLLSGILISVLAACEPDANTLEWKIVNNSDHGIMVGLVDCHHAVSGSYSSYFKPATTEELEEGYMYGLQGKAKIIYSDYDSLWNTPHPQFNCTMFAQRLIIRNYIEVQVMYVRPHDYVTIPIGYQYLPLSKTSGYGTSITVLSPEKLLSGSTDVDDIADAELGRLEFTHNDAFKAKYGNAKSLSYWERITVKYENSGEIHITSE